MRTVLFSVLSAAGAFSTPAPLDSQPAPLSLTGRVVVGSGADARPVRRAKVTLTGSTLTAPRIVDTDTAGASRFDRLPRGSFKISVQKPGFVTLEADAKPDATLTMTRGGAIDGIVTDIGGEPVSDLVVTALQMDNGKPKPIGQSRTDDLGLHRIHSLPGGEYFVEVAADGRILRTMPLVDGERLPSVTRDCYPAEATSGDARPVLVSAGRDATGVDVTFTPPPPVKDLRAGASPRRVSVAQRTRTTPGATCSKRSKTAGSCPGTIRRGSDARDLARSCAFRLLARPASPSTVCAIGTCFSKFS